MRQLVNANRGFVGAFNEQPLQGEGGMSEIIYINKNMTFCDYLGMVFLWITT